MSFDPDDPIGSVFAPVIGRPAWRVIDGYGSFLTLEFGAPHLAVREPIISGSSSARVRQTLARRRVTPQGDWSLWIYCCAWQAFDGDRLVGTSDGKRAELHRVAQCLDGQILTGVAVDFARAHTYFTFDLGGRLETQSMGDDDEQWSISTPESFHLSLRSDGACSWHANVTPPAEQIWQSNNGTGQAGLVTRPD
ncbi:MAG TPA: hypothetical protein VGM83_08185 [Devosiaceae bacterium]